MSVLVDDDPNPLSISYLSGMTRRQWPLMLIMCLMIGLTGSLLVSTREPKFRSTALLVLDRNTPSITGTKPDFAEHKVDTEVEMLRAMSVLARVAAELARDSNANMDTKNIPTHTPSSNKNSPSAVALELVQFLNALLSRLSYKNGEPAVKDEYSEELLALQQQFRIRRHGQTDVIAIEAKANSPKAAARLANLYANVYLRDQAEAKLGGIQRLQKSLELKIATLRTKSAEAGANIELRKELSAALAQLDQIRILESLTQPDLRLISKALPIRQVAFPSPRVLLLLSWMLSCGLAIGISFLWDQYRIRQHTRKRQLDEPSSEKDDRCTALEPIRRVHLAE